MHGPAGISQEDANRVCLAHGLGPFLGVDPVLTGATNRSYALEVARGRVFLRVYLQRDVAGVREEHALLDHLAQAGVPVPQRIPGPPPGDVLVQERPVALFRWIDGEQPCRLGVRPERVTRLGEALALAHMACLEGPATAAAPWQIDDLPVQIAGVRPHAAPELQPHLSRLERTLEALDGSWPRGLPEGVIHGDLFRENTFWDDNALLAILDWDTGGHGVLAYDLAITLLAWTFGDGFDWTLGRALCAGYTSVRPIGDRVRAALAPLATAASVRFTVSRIVMFEVGVPTQPGFWRDYRRFLSRLDALESLGAGELEERLLP